MRSIRLWLRLLSASLKSQMSYRRSFVMEIFGRFVVTTFELGAVFVLFSHIEALGGWSRWEVVYLYGVAAFSLGLGELVTDGLNEMPELIRRGAFDGILVRPVSPLVQVLGRQCRPTHIGRIAQGLLALLLAVIQLEVSFGPVQLIMLFFNIAGTTMVFAGIFVASAATTIFTIESAEAFNAFTYGGVEMARYPIPIYGPLLRGLFLFVVPVGYTVYFPAVVVLGKTNEIGGGWVTPWATPVVTATFVAGCLWFWSFAVDRYQSTGS